MRTLPAAVHAVAHAKINLHLGVGPVRPDGYHELVSVFQSLSLRDTLSVRPAPDAVPAAPGQEVAGLEVHTEGIAADGVPTDAQNLAWRAVQAVRKHLEEQNQPWDLPPLHLAITKGIPTAGGMAGGSADAAATLRAVNRLLEHPLSEQVLLELGAGLGSDVPFTLVGDTHLGTGRGEQLVPMMTRGTYHWVLCFDEEGLSTPAVFQRFDEVGSGTTEAIDETEAVGAALLQGDAHLLADALRNDLAAAAIDLQPRLAQRLDAGLRAGAIGGLVSGSGPTIGLLCPDYERAQTVANIMAESCMVAYASSPAAGAQVVSAL